MQVLRVEDKFYAVVLAKPDPDKPDEQDHEKLVEFSNLTRMTIWMPVPIAKGGPFVPTTMSGRFKFTTEGFIDVDTINGNVPLRTTWVDESNYPCIKQIREIAWNEYAIEIDRIWVKTDLDRRDPEED